MARRLALLTLALCLTGAVNSSDAQAQASGDPDTAAINALYGEWAKATATRGAEGYVSYFATNAVVLPPNAPAVEGQDAIRQWIQKELTEWFTRDARFIPGPMQVSNGWAMRRFGITGKRVSKNGGATTEFDNKYLDILQKQSDGSWKFVSRMWSSNR
jgi:ketosteroid isomerase-like protein